MQAFDGNIHSKWLDFSGAGGKTTWLEYALAADLPAVALQSYTLTSANDFPERDPRDFVLEGVADAAGVSLFNND